MALPTEWALQDRRREPLEEHDGWRRCRECDHIHGLGSRVEGFPVAYCDVLDECIGKATYELPRERVCDWPCWDEPVHWEAR